MSKQDKSKRVKLIANPGAGKLSQAANHLRLVTGYLEQNGFSVDIALAKPKEKATPIARRASQDGYKIVIAMGGDGTIEAVMRGILGSKARLGIIPAGTRNNIARCLGIPEDLEAACALIASDTMRKLDMGQVKTRHGKKFAFFEMATVGLSATIYPDANKVGNGKMAHLKATAMDFINHETRPKVFLTMNGESKIEVETMSVMVSNTPVYGMNFLVAPEASLQDGLLDISVYPEFSKVELIRYYASVMDGGYSADGKVQQFQARKLKVKSTPKLDVMADGVVLGRGTATIKALPKALRVIAPERSSEPEKSPGLISELKAAGQNPAELASLPEEKNHPNSNVILLG